MKTPKTAVFDVRTLLLLDILIMIFMLISGKPVVTLSSFMLAAAVPVITGLYNIISRALMNPYDLLTVLGKN